MSYTDQYKSDMTDIAKIYFGRISDENMVQYFQAEISGKEKRYVKSGCQKYRKTRARKIEK
jgi:hypothetical protein